MDVGTQTISALGEAPVATHVSVGYRGVSTGESSRARYREGGAGEEYRGSRGRYPSNGWRRYSLSQADRPQQYRGRRNSERFSHNPYNPSFKRRYYRGSSGGGGGCGREQIVLPTKFLLGGNINDPLNLNSLADEAVSRILNAPTPVPSPSTLPVRVARPDPPLEIIRPANLQDPLNLSAAADDEGAASAAVLVSNSSHRRRNRHRRHKQKKKSNTTESETLSSGRNQSVTTQSSNKNQSVTSGRNQSITSQSSGRNQSNESSHPVSISSRRSSCGSGSFAPGRRSTVADRIVSPVVPQVSPRRKRRRTLSVEHNEGKRFMSHPRGGASNAGTRMSRSIEDDSNNIGGETLSEVGDTDNSSNVKKMNSNNHRGNKRRRQPSTTEITQPKKYRVADEKFIHGNYVAYYGYRNPSGGEVLPDPRLKVLPEGLLEGKDVLDIGCNVGHVTLCIARDYNPRQIVGMDIDPKLIAMAKKNVRHYMDFRTRTVSHKPQQQQKPQSRDSGSAEGSKESNKAGILKSSDLDKKLWRTSELNSESISKRSVSFADENNTKVLQTISSDVKAIPVDSKTVSCGNKNEPIINDSRNDSRLVSIDNKTAREDNKVLTDDSNRTLNNPQTLLVGAKSIDETSETVLNDYRIVPQDTLSNTYSASTDLVLAKNYSDSVVIDNGSAVKLAEELGDETSLSNESPGKKDCARSKVGSARQKSTVLGDATALATNKLLSIPDASDCIKWKNKSEDNESHAGRSQSQSPADKVLDSSMIDNAAAQDSDSMVLKSDMSTEGEVLQIYPVSMEILYGPLSSHQVAVQSPAREPIREQSSADTCSTLKAKSKFPQNVMFQAGNYVPDSDEAVSRQRPEYDIILALSVTKWIHFNAGDEGLKRAFRRMYAQLRPGGRLVLEAQNWESYKKKKKLTGSIFKTYQSIQFRPEQFVEYLLSADVGFSTCRLIGVPYNKSKGFQRPIHIFTKKGSE